MIEGRLAEAKRELEAEARRQRAVDLREQAEGMEQTARGHTDPSMQQRLRTKAAKARQQADELDPPSDDSPPPGAGGGAGYCGPEDDVLGASCGVA